MDDVAKPVRDQLEAYNARDLDGFMRCWADDCLYYAFPDELLAEGADALRARHAVRFWEPGLHGELIARRVIGDIVIDQEVVTRLYDGWLGQADVVAIYQVRGGLIAKAWFIQSPARPHNAASVRP